jgi:histidinol-phosphate aminotransferase
MSNVSPQLMQRIRQDVKSMHAYAIQDSVGMVKLDAMENPHRLPAELQKALGERLGALAFNRYPDGRVNDLRHALASYAGMPEGFDIMLGNGSDELISLLAMACDVPKAVWWSWTRLTNPLPAKATSTALRAIRMSCSCARCPSLAWLVCA